MLNTRRLALTLALTSMLATSGAAHALEVQRTAAGVQFVSGGMTAQELAGIAASRARFSLALFARSNVSGGPLADAHVRIVDAAGTTLLDADMDGPWLLASLVPGRYQVAMVFQDETLRRDIEIPATGQRELVLSFRSDAEVTLNVPR